MTDDSSNSAAKCSAHPFGPDRAIVNTEWLSRCTWPQCCSRYLAARLLLLEAAPIQKPEYTKFEWVRSAEAVLDRLARCGWTIQPADAIPNRVHCALCGRFHDAPACKFGEPPENATRNHALWDEFLEGVAENWGQEALDLIEQARRIWTGEDV